MNNRSGSRRRAPSLLSFSSLTIAALLVEPASGQCATQWLPGPALAGTNAPVIATVEWDPDGAGPHGPLVVAGGEFTAAGNVAANHIAAYDPSTRTWRAFGSGMNATVRALAVLSNGDLVAAGAFTSAGGNPANRIARWDGTSWSALGAGLAANVSALVALPTGELVAGGAFTSAGGIAAASVAQWNGLVWAPLGAGLGPTVLSLAVLPNGQLLAGGTFTAPGGGAADKIAVWNGVSWASFGALPNAHVDRVAVLRVLPNGDVLAGGGTGASSLLSQPHVWRRTGTTWSILGSPTGWFVSALAALPNGDIAAGGHDMDIHRWNSSWSGGWTTIGWTAAPVATLTTLANGTLVAAGGVLNISGVNLDRIGLWNASTWVPAGPDAAAPLGTSAFSALPDGDVVSSATFASAGSPTLRVLRWTGATAVVLNGMVSGTVAATALLPNGDIVAAGNFVLAGGVPSRIARWNGTAWLPLGSGLDFHVFALTVLPNGDLIAAGDFQNAGAVPVNRIGRWNGTAWSPLGGGLNGSVKALAVLPNGDLVAGGTLGGVTNVARWNGTTWSPLGTMVGAVFALAAMPNGDVVAAGELTQASGSSVLGIARWTGGSWSPLGSGLTAAISPSVSDLIVLPNGDLVACGVFIDAGGAPAHGVARWNGAVWSPLALDPSGSVPGTTTMCLLPNGDLAVGGSLTIINGVVSARIARLTTTCPASAVASGIGCTGSGGPNVLTATSLPWLGSTFVAAASGLPASSLAMGVFGATTAAIPLATILPQGALGCSLLVGPDALSLLLPSGGTAQVAFTIPNSASLVGATFHEQVVPIELDATGSIVALTATNRLTLAIGAF